MLPLDVRALSVQRDAIAVENSALFSGQDSGNADADKARGAANAAALPEAQVAADPSAVEIQGRRRGSSEEIEIGEDRRH
jgi:hypothetical protein